MNDWRKPTFIAVAWAMRLRWLSAPIALAAGAAFAVTLGSPFAAQSSKLAAKLLKLAIIGLGFGLPLNIGLGQGGTALWVGAVAVVVALALGLGLLGLFAVERDTGRLIVAATVLGLVLCKLVPGS